MDGYLILSRFKSFGRYQPGYPFGALKCSEVLK
jgi:hypothetical protein